MTPQRVTLITLGVADMATSRAFYESLGWEASPRSGDDITFFQMNGMVLGLFGLEDLAKDQGRPDAMLATGAMTLAQNHESKAEVDAAYTKAIECGARVLKLPEEVFWGGYSGYYADPDGHVWEVAYNPFWPLQADGALVLPED